MYYLVSYDLVVATPDEYNTIDTAIQRMHGEKILETVWIVYRKNTTAQAIANKLSSKISEETGDQLVVVRFGDSLNMGSFSQIGLRSILKILKELKKSD